MTRAEDARGKYEEGAGTVDGSTDTRRAERVRSARLASAQGALPIVASASVVLALFALAIAPVLMTLRLHALQAEEDATTGRAHVLTDSLKTLSIDSPPTLEGGHEP